MPEQGCIQSAGAHHAGCCCSSRASGSLLEAYLLLLIAENPSHGYQLCSRLHEDFFPRGCAPDEATVYRNLRRMEEQGLVASSWHTEGAGPPRRFYDMTPKGLDMLVSWAAGIRERQQRLALFLQRFETFKEQPGSRTGGGDE
ncbi:MAG: PadR family transcriptional regulator [Ignavibacteriales bacterium]